MGNSPVCFLSLLHVLEVVCIVWLYNSTACVGYNNTKKVKKVITGTVSQNLSPEF